MISIKLQSNFIEITLRHECSPVNLLHNFRTPFSKNNSGWLLLQHILPNNMRRTTLKFENYSLKDILYSGSCLKLQISEYVCVFYYFFHFESVKFWGSRSQMSFKIDACKNLAIFRRKQLCWRLFVIKFPAFLLILLNFKNCFFGRTP